MNKKYFIARNGQYYTEYTKDEVYAMIDNENPATFIPFLQILDYPYIKQEWEHRLRYATQGHVFGKYCATMRLAAYRNFSYNDSEWLNEVREK